MPLAVRPPRRTSDSILWMRLISVLVLPVPEGWCGDGMHMMCCEAYCTAALYDTQLQQAPSQPSTPKCARTSACQDQQRLADVCSCSRQLLWVEVVGFEGRRRRRWRLRLLAWRRAVQHHGRLPSSPEVPSDGIRCVPGSVIINTIHTISSS